MEQTNLGYRIRERRRALNLTQATLADAMGCATGTISGWENGTFKPDIDTVDKLAIFLGTTSAYLLGYTNKPEREAVTEMPAQVISRGIDDEDPARFVVTEAEYTMLRAYRAADDRAREDALVILQAHKR